MTAPTPLPERSAPLEDGSDAAGPALRELADDAVPAPEEGLPGHNLRVQLEDGTELNLRTTNRDYLRWDKTPPSRRGGSKNFQDTPFLFATFLAWAAAQRQGLTALTFDQFSDAAVDVERLKADDVPPTQ